MTIGSEEYSWGHGPTEGIVPERRCKVERGWPEHDSSLRRGACFHFCPLTLVSAYETNRTIISIIHRFPTGSAVIC